MHPGLLELLVVLALFATMMLLFLFGYAILPRC